jgi:hypothetical protein
LGSNYRSKIFDKALMKNGSVVYLSYDGLTDSLGQSQILPYLTGLSEAGYHFTVISFEKEDAFIRSGSIVNKICAEQNIKWVPLTYHKRPPVLSTLYDLLILWRTLKKLYQQRKIDIVHCRSYLTSLVGLRAKRKWGVKFVFDMRGFWADERVEGGLWSLSHPVYKIVYKFFKEKEKVFLKEADNIVSLTHNAKDEIESWGLGNAPITVISTCVDTDLFDPRKISSKGKMDLMTKLGIEHDDFVLLYLGSWGTWYLTKEMLNFFTLLKERKPKAKFLIVSGDEVDKTDHPYSQDIIVTPVLRAEVPLHISLAHISVCFIKPTFSKKASAATKMGEILSMRIPIIVNPGWGDVQWFAERDTNVLLLKDITRQSFLSILDRLPSMKAALNSDLADVLKLEKAIESYKNIYVSMF